MGDLRFLNLTLEESDIGKYPRLRRSHSNIMI